MFSEVQNEYIRQLLITYHKEYPFYIVYSNSNISQYSSYDDYNFYVILCKNKIEAQGRYSFNIPSGSIRLGVRSGNSSYSYHSERTVRLQSISTLTVPEYEFIYTNAEAEAITIQPDILATQELRQDTFNGFGVALLIVLLSVVVFRLVRR